MNCESPSRLATWSFLRLSAGSRCSVVLGSGSFLRLATHFFEGTFLCAEGDECAACALLPSRFHWYLPAFSEVGNRRCLLELSGTTASDLEQRAKFAGLRVQAGLKVVLERKFKRSPLRAEAISQAEVAKEVPFEVWASGLMRIFGLCSLRPSETIEEYGLRVREQILRRAEVVAFHVAGGPPQRGGSRR